MVKNDELGSAVFPRGSEIASDNFIGKVWLERLVTDSVFGCMIGHVTFAPGARNSWHRHPGGQILLVTGGSGCYQERGQPARMLQAGDVVEISPGVEHWHGATPDCWFSHLAISTHIDRGEAQWLEPVTDQEYGRSGG